VQFPTHAFKTVVILTVECDDAVEDAVMLLLGEGGKEG
jgi:hypothetical protein